MAKASIHIAAWLIVGLIWFGVYKIERFRYKDCLRVGHSKTFCLLDIGR